MVRPGLLGLIGLAHLISAQSLDLDLLTDLEPLSTATIPVVYISSAGAPAATALTSTYSQSAVLASISSVLQDYSETNTAVLQGSGPDGSSGTELNRRATAVSTCLAQPTGHGPIPSPDNASAFISFSSFAIAASTAPNPPGYTNVFSNLHASNSALGYLGFTTLQQYDPSVCAKKCSAITACQSFNIYFERDPAQSPDDSSCEDPKSTTQIKCSFCNSQVIAANAKNTGQWRNKFQVVIAGSNGYVNTTVTPPQGYKLDNYLNDTAIVDPLDCNLKATYLNHVMFATGGPFDPNLCAVACSKQTSDAGDDTTGHCRFFNTYIIYKNGSPLGQDCSMYNQSWTSSEATNKGKSFGSNLFIIGSSYTFSSTQDVANSCIQASVVSSSSQSSTWISSSISTSMTSSSASSSASSSTSSSSTSSSISSSTLITITTSSSSSSSSLSSTSSSGSSSASTSTYLISFDLRPTSVSIATYDDDGSSTTVPTTVTPAVLVPVPTSVDAIAPSDTHPMDFARDETSQSGPLMRGTLYAREDSPLVNMETFIPYIASAECSSSKIQLTFVSEDAANVAKAWPQTFQLMTSGAAYCPGNGTARTFYSVSGVTFAGNTVIMDVTLSDISKSTSRLVTKFDTRDVDGTNSATSGKAKKHKRYGKDSDTWFHISIGSFPQWLKDFISGYHAGYNAVVDMEPIDLSKLSSNSFNPVIQCNNCGVEADIDLYGGFDITWYGHVNYAHVGFRVRNAVWNNLFTINVADGFNKKAHVVLGSLDLPGFDFEGILSVDPIVKLSSDFKLNVHGGNMNVDGFGLKYQQGSQDMIVEWDLKNNRATSSGWQDLEPKINPPYVDSIPNTVEFQGSIGPEFGVGVSIMPSISFLTISTELLAGFQVPAIKIDVSDHYGDSSNCIRTSKNPANAVDYPIDIRAAAGVSVYADFGVSAGEQSYTDQELIYQSPFWDAGSMCLVLAGPQINNPDVPLYCTYCAF